MVSECQNCQTIDQASDEAMRTLLQLVFDEAIPDPVKRDHAERVGLALRDALQGRKVPSS